MTPALGTIFLVTKTYVVDGRIVCDLTRMGTGATGLTAVPVLTLGGGPNRGLLVPPSPGVQPDGSAPGAALDAAVNQGAQVVVIWIAADPRTTPQPWILGATGHTGLGLSGEASTARESDDDADTTLDARAVALVNAGASLVLDQRGETTLAPVAGGNARVQLAQSAIMRVSRDGEASDAAVLAQALVDTLETAYTALADLQTQVADLTLRVTALTPPGTPPPTPYFPTIVTAPGVDAFASDVLRLSSDRPIA